MADHIGIVLKNESGRYARVVADRQVACGGCQSTPHGCRSCLASAKIESRVANPLGARPGDLVKVHLSSKNLFAGAAILFLLPVTGLLIGAITGALAAVGYGLSDVIGSIAGAAAGLTIGYLVVIGLERSPKMRERIMPTITAVLTSGAEAPENKKASCCS